MATENTNITPAQQQKAERSLMLSVLVIIAAVAALAIVGFCFMNKPADLVEGQVEGTTVRISGKLPPMLHGELNETLETTVRTCCL